MRQKLQTLSAVASLLLCVFFTASALPSSVKPRRYFNPLFIHASPTKQTDFAIADGVFLSHRTDAFTKNAYYPNTRETIGWNIGLYLRVVRLVYYPRWKSHGDNQTIEWGPVATLAIGIPGWICIVATGILPLLWIKRYLHRRREEKIRRQICLVCGYDLRASPDRCPECGTPTPPVAASP